MDHQHIRMHQITKRDHFGAKIARVLPLENDSDQAVTVGVNAAKAAIAIAVAVFTRTFSTRSIYQIDINEPLVSQRASQTPQETRPHPWNTANLAAPA